MRGASCACSNLGRRAPELFPDAPTLKELGLDLRRTRPSALVRLQGTPPAVVKRLHDAFKQAMEQENYRPRWPATTWCPIYMSSATYQKFAADTFERARRRWWKSKGGQAAVNGERREALHSFASSRRGSVAYV